MEQDDDPSVTSVIRRMEAMLAPLEEAGDARAYFLGTYLRTTESIAEQMRAGRFTDPEWTERWDIAFAGLYLDAFDQWTTTGTAPGPWTEAFAAAGSSEPLPPFRHVLLGINAHINYDLPLALLEVISDAEFDDSEVMECRRADHRRIDDVLASRVHPEDLELRKLEQPGDRTILDKALAPFNRLATRRVLAEAREKVWHNAMLLSRARRNGTLEARAAELEELSRQRVVDLRAPGQVVLRLAVHGFGVALES